MSKTKHSQAIRLRKWVFARGVQITTAFQSLRGTISRWRSPVPIAVLTADRARRRKLKRALRAGLRELRRGLGKFSPEDLIVIAQQAIGSNKQIAGCYQTGRQRNGARFALVRLSLQVNGRRVSADELLATLAEQCIGLAIQESGNPSVLIPFGFERSPQTGPKRAISLRPDPLAPRSAGAGKDEQIA